MTISDGSSALSLSNFITGVCWNTTAGTASASGVQMVMTEGHSKLGTLIDVSETSFSECLTLYLNQEDLQ